MGSNFTRYAYSLYLSKRRERKTNEVSESGERSLRNSNCALLSTRSAMIYGCRVCVKVLGVGAVKLCQLHNISVVLTCE
jgi:hypothetical protein